MPNSALPSVRFGHRRNGANAVGELAEDELPEPQLFASETEVLSQRGTGDSVLTVPKRFAGNDIITFGEQSPQLVSE